MMGGQISHVQLDEASCGVTVETLKPSWEGLSLNSSDPTSLFLGLARKCPHFSLCRWDPGFGWVLPELETHSLQKIKLLRETAASCIKKERSTDEIAVTACSSAEMRWLNG